MMVFVGLQVFGQQGEPIDLISEDGSGFQIIEKDEDRIKIMNRVPAIRLIEEKTPRGFFRVIKAKGYRSSFRKGYPDLPLKTRLIEIPQGSQVKVEITGYDEKIIPLNRHGNYREIIPAQPSRSKQDEDNLPFFYNKQVYAHDRFITTEIVHFESVGIMRGTKLGRLEISPFQYNPVRNQLKVLKNIAFELIFSKQGSEKENVAGDADSNPYFKSLHQHVIKSKEDGVTDNSFIGSGLITYVIVSPPGYEQSLKPFVRWKRRKGFHVIEGYTDSIGHTRQEIRHFLKDLYEQPAPTPPTFVLLVGDVEQIPSWESRTGGSHVTDLYYGEYTDDLLPEVFYGRFPARDTAELNHMIDKTLAYEKYAFSDPAFLQEALMVAGDDESYEDTYANGHVNYGTTYYFNKANGFLTHAFLQDPPEGNQAVRDSIFQYIDKGVGFATYTAHCTAYGWTKPGFNLDDIPHLAEHGKTGLWVSNCCWSLKFDDPECFGEAAIRAPDKGAVGVIGATDETYWDEDYWWGVGLTDNITAHPTYESSGLGFYDRMFHTHGEDTSQWYITQGQMVTAGNLAVEASTSSLKNFYWEVYHLLGDPSLMPYLGEPSPLSVSMDPSELTLGMDSLTVHTDPYAYVAFSFEGKLYDAQMANGAGVVDLTFPMLHKPADAELIITAQNKQPYMQSFFVSPVDQPYLIPDEVSISDSDGYTNGSIDFGETIDLEVTLKNLSDSLAAYEVAGRLNTNDTSIRIKDHHQQFGVVDPMDTSDSTGTYHFDVPDDIKDQYRLKMNLDITGKDALDSSYLWHSDLAFIINAPSLRIGKLVVDDGPGGNDSLDPGETADLYLIVHNEGHAPVSPFQGMMATDNNKDYLSLKIQGDTLGFLGENDYDTLHFRIKADTTAPEGMPIYFDLKVSAGKNGQYKANASRRIILGKSPVYLINESDTVKTYYGWFYDSGGPDRDYQNGESQRMTFIPPSDNYTMVADFKSFGVESDYDSLRIYDGPVSDSALIGAYDDDSKPGMITAHDISRALTFEFFSDKSITKMGWKAEIVAIPRNEITFQINSGKSPLKGVQVIIAGDTVRTDSSGTASFILDKGTYQYSIFKQGFRSSYGSFYLSGDMDKKVELQKEFYDVTFVLYGKSHKTPLKGVVELNGVIDTTEQGSCTFRNIRGAQSNYFTVNALYHEADSGLFHVTGDTVITCLLKKRRYPITIFVEDEAEQTIDSVAVQIDTVRRYTDEDGLASFYLPAGSYKLHLNKAHYAPRQKRVIVDGKENWNIQLLSVYRVEIYVAGEPGNHPVSNARILLDTLNLQTDSTGVAQADMLPGNYDYEVEAQGYEIFHSSITITDDIRAAVLLLENKTDAGNPERIDFSIYPNPADGMIRLSGAAGHKHMNIGLYTSDGTLLFNRKYEKTEITLDLSDWPAGIYILRIGMADQHITRKLILK
jgi:hypothetical protein